VLSKYVPLYHYLRRKPGPVEMSFFEIERVIRQLLPKSASQADWWSFQATLRPEAEPFATWAEAGFDAELVGAERVRFTRRSTTCLSGQRQDNLPD
jgi:hypothetical protein